MAQRIPTISRDEIKSVTKPEVPEVESESVQPASVEDVRNNLRGVTETMAKEMEPLRPGKGGYMPSIIEEFSNSGYFIITSHLDLAVLILVLSVVFGLILSMLYLRIIAKDLTALNKIISLSSASPARMLLFIIIGFIGYMA